MVGEWGSVRIGGGGVGSGGGKVRGEGSGDRRVVGSVKWKGSWRGVGGEWEGWWESGGEREGWLVRGVMG